MVPLLQLLWDALHSAGRHREALLAIARVSAAVGARFGADSAETQLVSVRLGISSAGAPVGVACWHVVGRLGWPELSAARPLVACAHVPHAFAAGPAPAALPPHATVLQRRGLASSLPLAACGQLEAGLNLIYGATPVLQHNLTNW